MMHFFGILAPEAGKRSQADEAPGKVAFFGGVTAHKDANERKREADDRAANTLSPVERDWFIRQNYGPHFW